MNKLSLTLALCFAALSSRTPSRADFTLFDNFNSYTPGANLIGQGPAGNVWTLTTGSPTGMVTQASPSGGGLETFVGPTGPSAAYRALGPGGLAIPNSSSAATVFWQFTLGGTAAYNWNFVVTDVNPTDTAGTSEVQFNLDSTAGNFRARNGGAFKNLSVDGTAAGNVPLVAGATYNVWFEVNNSADNYRVFMQSDTVPNISGRTQVFANDGTTPTGSFGFRNGTAANDLINVNFGSGNGQTVQTRFDNIYVDIAGFNSINPVPEPSTWALGCLGALMIGWRCRKKHK
jgi:hypothetical protein